MELLTTLHLEEQWILLLFKRNYFMD